MNPILQATPVIFLALILMACSPSNHAAPPDVNPHELLAMGKTAYAQNCATCHYGGRESKLAPDLIGSAIVNDPDPAALIRIILHGQQRVSMVGGKKFNGIMPPQAYLSDRDIAAITTYVRQEFSAPPLGAVQPSAAAPLRK